MCLVQDKFLTLLINCSFSKHFISYSSIDSVNMKKQCYSVCFWDSKRVHGIWSQSMRRKEGKTGKIQFLGNGCLGVHFCFGIGLNTVSIIQINFPFLLFISYHWTSGNKFSMQEIYTQGGFNSLLSFFPRASLKSLLFGERRGAVNTLVKLYSFIKQQIFWFVGFKNLP